MKLLTRTLLLVAAGAVWIGAAAMAQDLQPLGFGERIACQERLEEVYWRHRLWPEVNPGTKPSLAEVLPYNAVLKKVEDAVRLTRSLEEMWHWSIDGAQLQAEIDRMAAATRNPDLLSELWAALDSDPRLVAECLARPLLVERLARGWHEQGRQGDDSSFLAWWGAAREEFPLEIDEPSFAYLLSPIQGAGVGDSWTPTPSLPLWTNGSAVWTGAEMIFWGGGAFGSGRTQTGSRYDPATDTWTTTSTLGGASGRFLHTAVWTGTEMIVWGGCGPFEFLFCALGSGGRYNPVSDSWVAVQSTGGPGPRFDHTAAWTGTEMIVWGGCKPRTEASCTDLDTGGRYDPASDSWQETSMVGVPIARSDHSAIWTGSEMIVWGGYDGLVLYESGGRYDPATDTWSSTSLAGAPTGRRFHTAVWSGAEMIVFGGCEAAACPIQGDPTQTGASYDPGTDSWIAIATAGAPSPRTAHTAVWTGTRMIVWGGDTPAGVTATGGLYDPTTDGWTSTSSLNAPSARSGPRAVWTGTLMLTWGGGGGLGSSPLNTGGRYDPATDSWTPTSNSSPEVARELHTAVWTGTEMIVWGGDEVGGNLFEGTGSIYTPATASWRPTSLAGAPFPRFFHTAVWTGTEMIVWGGQAGTFTFQDGARYDPITDAWVPTSLAGAPDGRATHSVVWTGSEMIVWGGTGQTSFNLNTGGRYDPAADSWADTTMQGAPAGRRLYSAVWTGDEMIVWGGSTATGDTSTGGRYDPATDAWSATSMAGAPVARNQQLAVWTGGEMVIWGGVEGFLFSGGTFPESGGRYEPVSDSWLPTALLDVPTPRALHTAIWTGSEMIVWGGCTEHNCGDELATGSRYDPIADSWTATDLGAGTPSPRRRHSAVWTGSEMIVWGGFTDQGTFTVTGARYLPGPAQPAAHVAAILLRFRPAGAGFRLSIGVNVGDAGGAGVDAVLVGLELTRPNGSIRLLEATTDGSGRARASVSARQAGIYRVCVTSLGKDGWLYDEEANVETCDEIIVE